MFRNDNEGSRGFCRVMMVNGCVGWRGQRWFDLGGSIKPGNGWALFNVWAWIRLKGWGIWWIGFISGCWVGFGACITLGSVWLVTNNNKDQFFQLLKLRDHKCNFPKLIIRTNFCQASIVLELF